MNAIASLGRRVIERVRGIGTATLLLLQVGIEFLSYSLLCIVGNYLCLIPVICL